jgi:hypothetical protein
MEMIKSALQPAALEARRLMDEKAGPQSPLTEVVYPSYEGNRKQRRAAESLARKQRKRELA